MGELGYLRSHKGKKQHIFIHLHPNGFQKYLFKVFQLNSAKAMCSWLNFQLHSILMVCHIRSSVWLKNTNCEQQDCPKLAQRSQIYMKTEQLEASQSEFDCILYFFFIQEKHSRSYMHSEKCESLVDLPHNEPRAGHSPSAYPYPAAWAPPWCHGSEAWWSWPERWTCSLG